MMKEHKWLAHVDNRVHVKNALTVTEYLRKNINEQFFYFVLIIILSRKQ